MLTVGMIRRHLWPTRTVFRVNYLFLELVGQLIDKTLWESLLFTTTSEKHRVTGRYYERRLTFYRRMVPWA